MMRIPLFICFLLSVSFSYSQQKITVRKSQKLEGFYQLQTENKTTEFLYFDKKGNVAIVEGRKRKKARGNLLACVENNNCQTAIKSTYKLDKLEISFSFNRGQGESIHFVEYDGQLSPDALFLTLKKGETGKLIEVKEYRRLK